MNYGEAADLDWTDAETFQDVGAFLLIASKSLKDADVTSATNGVKDGLMKSHLISEMKKLAYLVWEAEVSFIPQASRDYQHNEGHRKD